MMVGEQALPIATLFGMVRSSGVIGFDEKWVLVPKNDKPEGKRKRWMYVYLAVDVFTYDVPTKLLYSFRPRQQERQKATA